MSVRAWNLIPFVDVLDQDDIAERIGHAKRLAEPLREYFRERQLSPAFLHAWGRFCATAGAVQMVYLAEPSVGNARRAAVGAEGDLTRNKVWFARQCLAAYDRLENLAQARSWVEQEINRVIELDVELPQDMQVDWFEKFLNLAGDGETNANFGKLTKKFRTLSLADMRILAAKDEGTSFPLNLEPPTP